MGKGIGAKKSVYRENGPLPPPLWGSSVNDLERFRQKQQLKIDCNFQFSIFRLRRKQKQN